MQPGHAACCAQHSAGTHAQVHQPQAVLVGAQVLQGMLSIASSVSRANHTAMMDLVVVYLVLFCGLLTLVQFGGILGWIGHFHPPTTPTELLGHLSSLWSWES